MKKITPCLWFDNKAEEAAKYYVSKFPNSKILSVSHYSEGMPMPAGTVLLVNFELNGQPFQALNGGPEFTFSEAVSFSVDCETQQEIDEYWDKLTADGGEPGVCGWLKDKYGLSWQIVPAGLEKMMQDKDAARVNRVMQEVMQMTKPDIRRLEDAYAGRSAA